MLPVLPFIGTKAPAWLGEAWQVSGVLVGLVIAFTVFLLQAIGAQNLRSQSIYRAVIGHTYLLWPLVFSLSFLGLAGAVDIIGVQGNVRADWNPAYGMAVIPVVFLARMNGFAAIAFVFLFSILSIGGESAARRLGVPQDFTLVFVAIVLIVLALAEYYTQHSTRMRGAAKA